MDKFNNQNTRRGFLIGVTAGAAVALGATDKAFWNRKKHEDWSGEEVHQLTTKSPWVKEVRVELKTAGRGGYDGGSGIPGAADDRSGRTTEVVQTMPGGRMPGPDSPGLGTGGGLPGELPGEIGDSRRGTGGNLPIDALVATVRWESAQPLVDALHTNFPPDFAEHYVISVSGLPALQGKEFLPGDEGAVERFKGSAGLQAKGKPGYQPGVIHRTPAGMWFGFNKEFMPLTPSDRDLLFFLTTNQLEVRAHFDPKDMLYLGKLAV